jgi:hypothetical protein
LIASKVLRAIHAQMGDRSSRKQFAFAASIENTQMDYSVFN